MRSSRTVAPSGPASNNMQDAVVAADPPRAACRRAVASSSNRELYVARESETPGPCTGVSRVARRLRATATEARPPGSAQVERDRHGGEPERLGAKGETSAERR